MVYFPVVKPQAVTHEVAGGQRGADGERVQHGQAQADAGHEAAHGERGGERAYQLPKILSNKMWQQPGPYTAKNGTIS